MTEPMNELLRPILMLGVDVVLYLKVRSFLNTAYGVVKGDIHTDDDNARINAAKIIEAVKVVSSLVTTIESGEKGKDDA